MFLLKHAAALLEPLGIVWLALAALAWWLRKLQQRGPSRAVFALWVFFTLMTCFPVADRMLASVESPWRDIATRWDALPQCDAILCLGGGIQPSSQEIIGVDVSENSDRPTTAIELLRRGKAPLLLVSGGKSLCGPTEAEAVAIWVAHWQLTTAKVEAMPPSVDTHDEAMKLSEMGRQRGWKRLMLVTSASHMTRASAVFRKNCAFEIVPVPCAFATVATPDIWFHLPATGGLEAFGTWFHEVVGRLVYKLRGWI